MLQCVGTLIYLSEGMGAGVAWYVWDGTVDVIFENIEFCIFGIVGIVGAGVALRDVGMRLFLSTRWLFWIHIPVRVLSFVRIFPREWLAYWILSGVGSLR